MGSFITNLHVRDAEPVAVIDALRSLAVVPAYVRRASGNRWTSIYPEAAFQDDVGLSEIAHALSTALQRPVIGFIVHDSDILLYVLVDHGKLLDSYNSAPGFFTGQSLAPTGGQAEVVAAYCEADDAHARLSRLLHPETSSRNEAPRPQNDVLEGVRKKLIESYPKMAAQDPNTPPLEQLLAEIERRFASWPVGQATEPNSAKPFLLEDDRLTALAELLGIPSGPVLDSFFYLANGEGATGRLTLIEADGQKDVSLP
ncbi:hypothetical protein [Bradyrhizobium sp. SRS-191]|uniref:hypothetical protein n=1 Tax=Bradyrhizobium sp. SRS-191 TaxID=2962606 RepID=UPI00211E7BFD|nr:hypothetical protein [Bradyrhizobium sp. SRS-191]